jgi:hypothetical protein
MDFCLNFVPFGHYDEPEILRYAITSICPKGADVRHVTVCLFGKVTGQELADLARFTHDAETQRKFQETDVPELIRDWMVDEVYDELGVEEMGQF